MSLFIETIFTPGRGLYMNMGLYAALQQTYFLTAEKPLCIKVSSIEASTCDSRTHDLNYMKLELENYKCARLSVICTET